LILEKRIEKHDKNTRNDRISTSINYDFRICGAFVPHIESGLSSLFWGCAGGTLIIIIYRKRKRKQAGLE